MGAQSQAVYRVIQFLLPSQRNDADASKLMNFNFTYEMPASVKLQHYFSIHVCPSGASDGPENKILGPYLSSLCGFHMVYFSVDFDLNLHPSFWARIAYIMSFQNFIIYGWELW